MTPLALVPLGRLTGSPGNVEAMKRLEKALRDLGVTTQRQTFSMPGWERSEDRVDLQTPPGPDPPENPVSCQQIAPRWK